MHWNNAKKCEFLCGSTKSRNYAMAEDIESSEFTGLIGRVGAILSAGKHQMGAD
jgi:hypothetical protein